MVDNTSFKNTVKSLGEQRIGGYLCAFGTPNDTDLQGEYFTKDTNFEINWYKERPLLYSHGMDKSHKTKAIGTIDKLEIRDDAGLWAEAQLQEHFMYQEYIMQFVKEGKIGYSSGSSPYYAEVDKNGFIRTWPIHEGSLTMQPAQPDKTAVQTLKHYTDVNTLHSAIKDLGLENYNIDDLMLQYEQANDSDETKTKVGLEQTGRPIEIVNKIFLAPDLFNKETNNIKKDNKMTEQVKDNLEVENTEENTEENQEVVAQESDQPETAAAAAAAPPPETQVDPEPIKEVSDTYFAKMAQERMMAFDIPVVQTNVQDSVAKAKDWIRSKTFSPMVTFEIAEYARTNADFQKFYNELIKSYTPKPQEALAPATNPEMEAMKAQLAKMQQMLGQGGQSKVAAADAGGQNDNFAKNHSFYFIEDAAEKANYANYSFEDLAYYGWLRDEMTRKGLSRMPWHQSEQDHFYNALFNAGKDIIPNIQHLIPNHNWVDRDREDEEVHAVKAFRYMAKTYRGKAIKANEVLQTGLSGRGEEWIWTLPDGSLWNILLSDTSGVINSIPTFNMGAGEVDMYLDDEMGFPSLIPEIVNAGDSATARNDAAYSLGNYAINPAGTQKLTFKARHIGHQTVINKIQLEDGKIDAARNARMHLEHAMQRGIVWAIINAHSVGSTSTVNYGHYGVTTGGTQSEKRGLANIGFDGLIARALTKTPVASVQAGADVCVALLEDCRRQMNSRYYTNHSKIRIMMDTEMHDQLWSLDEFRRAASYRGSWDGGSGNEFSTFQGTPIITTEELEKRNSSGQRSATATDNTRPVIIMFRPDRMKMGIRRRLSRTMNDADAYGEWVRMGTSLRFDFQTIPNAVPDNSGSDEYGSGLTRKPVSVLYDLN